jgi:endonuclease G
MDETRPVYEEADARLEHKRAALARTYEHLASGTARLLSPDVTTLRAKRLIRSPLDVRLFDSDVVREIDEKDDVRKLSERAQVQLERVIRQPDFLPVWFLQRGAELRRTVGKIVARTSGGRSMDGTGFLVGPGLLLTNSHVLDWSDIKLEPLAGIAPYSSVVLDMEELYDGTYTQTVTFDLDPQTLLLQSSWKELDYVLVAVKARSTDGKYTIGDYGYNRLTAELGKITEGEVVFIIQHPLGRTKQVVLNDNRLFQREENCACLYYEADTDNGSSGSPVYNRQWEVVALHHASRRFSNGAVDNPAPGVEPALTEQPATSGETVLNEGIRISRILKDLSRIMQESEAGNQLPAPQCVSEGGLQRLRTMLATKSVAAPDVLVGSIPVAEPKVAISSGPVGRYPRPD